MPNRSEFHGIIVKEGIRDRAVLSRLKILGVKAGKKWTLLKIGVESSAIDEAVRVIQANLVTENGIPYYAHLYRDDELIIIFPERVFRASTDKKSWIEAVTYGESLKVPRAELDFKPCKFDDETF